MSRKSNAGKKRKKAAAQARRAKKVEKKEKRPKVERLTTLYFAYGSNLDVEQMGWRCPDAVPLMASAIPNAKLAFRGGLADIEPSEGDLCPGGIWEVSARDVAKLDRYEGFPHLYVKEWIRVKHDGRVRRMLVYRMRDQSHELVPPSEGYLNCILRGLQDFHLGDGHVYDAIAEAKANARGSRGEVLGRAAREKAEEKAKNKTKKKKE